MNETIADVEHELRTRPVRLTATLHIEHPITDLETWLAAFTRFEEARTKAGVRAQRVCQPVDDDKYIYVTLDFDSVDAARCSPAPRARRAA